MSEADYAAFVNAALFLDHADPVAAWQRLSERQLALEQRLAPAREIRIEAEGTDLRPALATDAGARRLGELGIGTNTGIDRASGHILLDEKMAGTVHLALGRSYPETGGTNVSALHWDLICDLRDGGRLSADGETIVQDGQLTS